MSENLKTIKELADELGVSKQAIQYHIKFLPTENRQKNDKKQTEDTQEKVTVNSVLLEQVSDLKEQNNDLRKLLDQQQQLHFKTQQMLEEKTLLLDTARKRKWWNFLKK